MCLRNTKRKDWRKANRAKGTCGTPSSRPVHTLSESQKEKRERCRENIWGEEKMAENFTNSMKEMNINMGQP